MNLIGVVLGLRIGKFGQSSNFTLPNNNLKFGRRGTSALPGFTILGGRAVLRRRPDQSLGKAAALPYRIPI
jgi:hypothetical protein